MKWFLLDWVQAFLVGPEISHRANMLASGIVGSCWLDPRCPGSCFGCARACQECTTALLHRALCNGCAGCDNFAFAKLLFRVESSLRQLQWELVGICLGFLPSSISLAESSEDALCFILPFSALIFCHQYFKFCSSPIKRSCQYESKRNKFHYSCLQPAL